MTSSDADRQAVLDFVLRYFPRQFDFVDPQLEAMQESRVQLGVAGSILMVWAAMGVFGAITSAVNHAWGVEKQPSYFKHKMISFVMLVMASLLLLAALVLVSAINVVEASWFAAVVERHDALRALQGFAVALGEHRSRSSSWSAWCSTSSRTRRCGSGTSGSARWSQAWHGAARSPASRGTSAI